MYNDSLNNIIDDSFFYIDHVNTQKVFLLQNKHSIKQTH